MQKTPIVKDEIIGRIVTITNCTDPSWIGKSGIILDETKNTFLIEINEQEKRIAKKSATFEFERNGKKTQVEGSRLIYRPEDRIKKAR